MTISTFAKGFAGALTASAICVAAVASAGATTLTLTNPPTQLETPMTVTFTARGTEGILVDEGYQVHDVEYLTDNMVTLSGGGPNLLGPTWGQMFAAMGSNSSSYDDGTPVPALAFAARNPPLVDTFYQTFATVPGDTYTYSFDYTNNNAGHGATPSLLVVSLTSVPEPSTWAMMLLGFAGLGFAGYRASRRIAASAA